MASRESQAPDPAVVAELFATSRELIERASATVRRARQVRDHHGRAPVTTRPIRQPPQDRH